jgi:hypothetical protein
MIEKLKWSHSDFKILNVVAKNRNEVDNISN